MSDVWHKGWVEGQIQYEAKPSAVFATRSHTSRAAWSKKLGILCYL